MDAGFGAEMPSGTPMPFGKRIRPTLGYLDIGAANGGRRLCQRGKASAGFVSGPFPQNHIHMYHVCQVCH
jgi:hypothetical protein